MMRAEEARGEAGRGAHGVAAFYDSALGALVSRHVSAKLAEAWGTASGQRVAAFGYATPFLAPFAAAERVVALVPEGTGLRRDEGVPSAIVAGHLWPLPDASVDRLLIVHGLEDASGPRRTLREAWRVLADDGLMIVVAANRRGPWALVETTPFGGGRPYSRRQLDRLLQGAMFTPTAYASALHFPPIDHEALLRVANTWERLGDLLDVFAASRLLPNLAGVNLIEARKGMAVPIQGSKAEAWAPVFSPAGLRPARFGAPRSGGARRDQPPPAEKQNTAS